MGPGTNCAALICSTRKASFTPTPTPTPTLNPDPQLQVTYRANSLANTIVHYLINSGFNTLYAALSDHLPDIIEMEGLDWIEAEAEDRTWVLKR